jgi:prolyl oligopeptidase
MNGLVAFLLEFLYAYSPYHHVKAGVAYPATLVFAAESESRVDPLHARKFVARLQAAHAGLRPILLRMEGQAGHGAGKPLGKLIEQHADEMAFLFGQFGLSSP